MGAICDIIEKRFTKESLGHPSSLKYWIGKMFYGLGDTPTHGIDVTEDTALTLSSYWRAINILSDAISCLPFKIYKRLDPRGKKEIKNNISYLLNYKPNPVQDARVFKKTLQAHAVGWGNGYAEIERNNKYEPIALWPLLPDRTTPKLIGEYPNQELFYEVWDGAEHFMIPGDDVLHISGLGFDGIKGYSLIKYAAWTLGLGMAADRYSADFFGNNAVPPGGISVPEPMGEKEVKALKDAWRERFAGTGRKKDIAVLHSGQKWEPFAVPAKDAELIATKKISISDISRLTGIPPHMLSDMEFSKFNNIEHLGMEFRTWGLWPWQKAWELQADIKLIGGKGDYFAEILTDAILRTDTYKRYQCYNIGINGGFLCPDDAREKENLNPLPNGEGQKFRVPLNMQVVGEPKPDEILNNRWMNSVELINRTWERILTKETKSLMTASAKGKDAIENCYDKLDEHINSVLWPVIKAVFGKKEQRLEIVVNNYISEHRSAAVESADKNGNIKILTERWRNECPDLMTQKILRGYYNALS